MSLRNPQGAFLSGRALALAAAVALLDTALWELAPLNGPVVTAERGAKSGAEGKSDRSSNQTAGSKVKVLAGHPRLFLPPGRLPALLNRARGQLGSIYVGKVKRDCDQPMDSRRIQFTCSNPDYLLSRALSLLVCYRIEQADAYREKALVLANAIAADTEERTRQGERIGLQALSILYDGLYDTLAKEDKARLRDAILARCDRERGVFRRKDEFVSGFSHFSTASLVIAAIALHDGSDASQRELESALEHWEKFLRVARYLGQEGGHHLGWRYGRSYIARLVWVSEAIASATSCDAFAAEKSWLSKIGYHCAYGLRPDNTYFRIGDSHRYIFLNLNEDLLIYALLSSRYRDRHIAGFAHRTLQFCSQGPGLASDPQYVYPLLFLDPDLPPLGADDLPLVRAFPRTGNFVLRSGWGPEDTVVLFRAMPWYHFNHERRDFGSFLVYHRGGLAVHGGTYQAGDDASDYGGSHLTNYAWRTIAHNTITVFDSTEKFCSPVGPVSKRCEGENRWSNDGGHAIRSDSQKDAYLPFFQPRDADDIEDPRFAQGSVPTYEDRPELTYIVADGTKAFRPSKVELFERHFLYLKKVAGWRDPVIVVYDRVAAHSPEFRKTWHLHIAEPPRIENRLAVIENRTRVAFSKENSPKAKDYWCAYSGKMYCQSLLPIDASMTFVGGEGKEFWVDGKNYPTEIREVDRVTEPGIGRIEVTPSRPGKLDLFLHVLSPTDADNGSPPPECALLETSDGVGLRIKNLAVLLPDSSGPRSRLSYRIDSPGSLTHVVTGLGDAVDFKVSRGDKLFSSGKTSPNGILVFSSSGGGAFEIRTEASQ